MTPTIRKLKVNDLENGFLETLSNLFDTNLTLEESRKIYENVSHNPTYRIFVAELDEKVVGATTLLIEQKFILGGAKFGYIEDVAVRVGFEGRGVGSMLVRAAVKEAKGEGCCVVRLDCKEKNVVFYEKNGFHRKTDTSRMQIDLLDLRNQ